LRGIIALLAACGGEEPVAITHDACAPLTLVGASTETQQHAIADAMAMWREQGAFGLGAGDEVEVRFEAAADVFHGLYDGGVIYVNESIAEEPTLAIVIAHELGHAFGLVHVSDRVSVMNPGNLLTPPNDSDRVALQTLWGTCDATK
jgi:hypothetical protein